MISTLKRLGLALFALLAMGVVIVSGASAATFHSENASTIITGENEGVHIFGVASGSFNVECLHANFKGTSLGEGSTTTNETVTLHPTYSNCTTPLGPATIDTTGCNYVFGSETTASGHLPAEIECTTGFAIKVTAPGCTLVFGTQKTLGGVTVKNEGSGTTRDTTTVSTTTANFTKELFGCGVVSGNTGTFTGATTLKGFEDKGVSGNKDEDSAVYTEGPQIGIWWE